MFIYVFNVLLVKISGQKKNHQNQRHYHFKNFTVAERKKYLYRIQGITLFFPQ